MERFMLIVCIIYCALPLGGAFLFAGQNAYLLELFFREDNSWRKKMITKPTSAKFFF